LAAEIDDSLIFTVIVSVVKSPDIKFLQKFAEILAKAW